jgi:TolB-like protein/Tfp pilus assembly protein PilF
MGEPRPGKPDQRLDSWKSIAEYLSRDVRTVIRWEKERGLPVHRIPGGKKQAVFAFTQPLDAWLMSRAGEINAESERVLAVLPFSNDSGRDDLNYLADGLTESLISRLSQIPTLRVLARSTVFRYRGPDVDPLAAARELKVQTVLTGVLRNRADQLQISLEMLNARDGSQIWGLQQTNKLDDTWEQEAGIADRIASQLRVHLGGDQQERLTKRFTTDAEALRLYWKSRYEFFKFSEQGIKSAIDMLQQAVARDPLYAKAHAALAECYSYLAFGYSSERPPREWIERAIEAARTAIRIDDTLAEAHVALALSLPQVDLELDLSECEFKRSLELNPSLAQAHIYYSYLLLAKGRVDKVEAHLTDAVGLDPFSPMLLADAAALFGFAGMADKGMALVNKALALDGENGAVLYIAGFLHQMKGEYECAIELLEQAVEKTIMHTVPLGILGNLYAVTGDVIGAHRMLARLNESLKRQPAAYFSRAIVYCGLGDNELALRDLERAAHERISWMVMVHRVPWFESLREDSRFQEIVRRLKLA